MSWFEAKLYEQAGDLGPWELYKMVPKDARPLFWDLSGERLLQELEQFYVEETMEVLQATEIDNKLDI